MNQIIAWVNSILYYPIAILYAAMSWMPPIGSLTAMALLTAVLFLWLYGYISDQAKITHWKNQIGANLLAVRLFQNDLRVFFRIQGRVLLNTLRYMRCALIPLLIMIVPIVLILVQLNLYYAAKPVPAGEPTLLTVHVQDSSLLENRDSIELQTPEGVKVETPAVVIAPKNEICWRIHGEQAGQFALQITVGDNTVEKRFQVGGNGGEISTLRPGASWAEVLLYAGEPIIPAQTGIASITIDYPYLPLSLFGWEVNWIVWYTIMTIVFGFAMKGWFGIEI